GSWPATAGAGSCRMRWWTGRAGRWSTVSRWRWRSGGWPLAHYRIRRGPRCWPGCGGGGCSRVWPRPRSATRSCGGVRGGGGGLAVRVGQVRELLTGDRRGWPELAGDGEPRGQYVPGVSLMARYTAKAAELGMGVSTLRRWVAAFTRHGPEGLLRADTGRGG